MKNSNLIILFLTVVIVITSVSIWLHNYNSKNLQILEEMERIITELEELVKDLEVEEANTDIGITSNSEPTIETISVKQVSSVKTYEREAQYIAKVVWAEARGCSTIEQAAVIWCILNRVDSNINGMGNDIIDVVTKPNQFAYNASAPVTAELYELSKDVISRWEREKNGETNVGRVLPKEYLWFHGDGTHNYFRNSFVGGNRWNWSLTNPYK